MASGYGCFEERRAGKEAVPSLRLYLDRRHGLTDPWRIRQAQHWCAVRYVLFDLLHHAGRCLLREPLVRRREVLAEMCQGRDVAEVQFSAGVMDANGLTRHYDKLTPRERLPLIVAAVDRGDDAEADRLTRSAPRDGIRLPNYHGLAEGMLLASLFHMMTQLDRIALYWQAEGIVDQYLEIAKGNEQKAKAQRLSDLARRAVRLAGVQLRMQMGRYPRIGGPGERRLAVVGPRAR
jgi:hypothetical protein